jgi:hypothetical protein
MEIRLGQFVLRFGKVSEPVVRRLPPGMEFMKWTGGAEVTLLLRKWIDSPGKLSGTLAEVPLHPVSCSPRMEGSTRFTWVDVINALSSGAFPSPLLTNIDEC